MNQVDIHFDLESGSLHQDAAIYSIGAVAVVDGAIVDQFHIRIDPDCYGNRKRKRDNDDWWEFANPEEFQTIHDEGVILTTALGAFSDWLSEYADKDVTYWQKRWLDLLWVESACDSVGVQTPIAYHKVRELVTYVEALGGNQEVPNENAHNALADAKAQAKMWINAREGKRNAKAMV